MTNRNHRRILDSNIAYLNNVQENLFVLVWLKIIFQYQKQSRIIILDGFFYFFWVVQNWLNEN